MWFGLTPQAPLADTPNIPAKVDTHPAVTHALKNPLTYSQSGFIYCEPFTSKAEKSYLPTGYSKVVFGVLLICIELRMSARTKY